MSEPVIRFMRLRDVDAVAAIEQETFARPWSRESFRQELTRNTVARYLVAEEDGRILGYAGAWVILDESHITNIAVLESARGRGIGRKLVETVIQRIKDDMKPGYKVKLTLNSSKGKEPFYEKFGFRERPNEEAGAAMDQWLTL